jgi:hypothetical protein
MGTGQNNSFRWEPDRKLTDIERAVYWENLAMQYSAELTRTKNISEELALRLARRNKELSEYQRIYGPFVRRSDE